MAKVKYTGAGALVEVDTSDDGLGWTSVGCTNSITPPPQVKNVVEVTCQQDTEADGENGQEQLSQAQFVEPLDYSFSKTLIDDYYASNAVKDFRITFVRGSDTQVIKFPAQVSGLVPNPAGGNDEVTRVVTLTRKGAIEWNPN